MISPLLVVKLQSLELFSHMQENPAWQKALEGLPPRAFHYCALASLSLASLAFFVLGLPDKEK